jgi:hypothetical protein
MSVRRLCSDNPLLLTTALMLASNSGVDIVIEVVTVFVTVTLVLCGGDPEAGFPAVEWLVLAGKVMAFAAAGSVAATLRQSTGALRQLGGDRRIL